MVVAELVVVVTELSIAELVMVVNELAMVTELVMVTELGTVKLSVVIELAMVELVVWLIFSWGTSVTSTMLSTKEVNSGDQRAFCPYSFSSVVVLSFSFSAVDHCFFSFPFKSWRRLYE